MTKALKVFERGVTLTLASAIKGYQYTLGPLLPLACRYEPSCSHYALEALRRYGPWRGAALATRRVLRCNPFHAGGFDPVP